MTTTNTQTTTYPYNLRQLVSPFRTAAYRYVRERDQLPMIDDVESEVPDPLCKVKLFLTGSRFAFYVYAIQDISPAPVVRPSSSSIILHGVCRSPLGPDCDECGPIFASEILEIRNSFGLPVERDLYFNPLPISEVFELIKQQ